MDDRTRLLTEWVDQPSAGPLVQYLRDAERRAALDALDSPTHVLDIASETGVTRALPDDATVTRLDFSPEASARARESLETVDAFESTTPETPTLPFGRSRFDAAVCVGPLDWRFLDADRLASEVSRVLTRDGTFAVTAPTPESPYHVGGRYELTYRTPDEFETTLAPHLHPTDQTYIYQPPEKVQWLAGKLPAELQRPVARYAQRRTETCSRNRASYVVTGASAPGYRPRIDDALDCLLRPVSDHGFFDPETDRFHGRLDYSLTDDDTMAWRAGEGSTRRYGPLALLGVARWRHSSLGDDRHDDRIRRLAVGYERLLDAEGDELPSYALGPLTGAFALLSMAGFDTLSPAEDAFARSRDRFSFDHSEDGLLLHGWSYLHDALADPTAVTDALREGAQAVAARQDPETGLFAFDNPTTDRHQNQMYVLWGLCRAVEVAAGDGYLENAEAVLDYTLDTRLRDDGALLWLEPGRIEELSVALGRGEYPQWKLLFACHQSFFAIAAAHYRRAATATSTARSSRRWAGSTGTTTSAWI
ncbi:MAG: methyltransferase domain-containing protein [Halobacteriales archaeon]|nr:methyltransferase domain-containing protein [Halobacteriales archaeon]